MTVRVAGLSKSFGARTVLKELDLTAPGGELTALIGRSGCGKSTLLRIIAGFDRPDAGTVTIAGSTVTDVPSHRRRIGYVTQEGHLFPHLTVAGNVTFGLPRRVRRDDQVVAELLELVALDRRYARRYPHQLSGGEQQRVALARALATRPDVVLLDEPFSALDAELRVDTRRAVTAALAATHTTTLLVTHDLSEALSLAKQVAVLRDGMIVQAGLPEEIYRRPADRAVAAFVGELTAIPALLAGDKAVTALGTIALTESAHGTGSVLVRPEQIVVTDPRPGLPLATTLAIDFRGHDGLVRLLVDVEIGKGLTVTARVAGQLLPTPGQRVGVRLTGIALATGA
ncbi:ABC transporter ATP-binding protein [Acrocarpospora macrocephala]|uniref:ABC-type quaternary amine transporter n=1 Tax=Acrocarpospora macrocephala TaxID=150177 RepID=A0A5M3X2R4_9ACTN|nr:ABC transporter ATP-binding protein [Acrocarpospora macrocephala]GES13891.1 Fe(3+) ions import ATP-binding protein FbpC [Acrocarpospora macrocephala]